MARSAKTHIQRRREWASALKGRIMALLGWDDLQYGEFQYEQGVQYLESYLFPDSGYYADQISRNKVFWNWWKNHWALRDEMFLRMIDMITVNNKDYLRNLYHEFNHGKLLGNKITLSGVVLHESYSGMISELVETETKKDAK